MKTGFSEASLVNEYHYAKQKKWTYDNTPKRKGRPGKNKQTEQLVVKLAEENTWGYRNHYYIVKEAA